jgi:hypothetical protein
VLGVLRGRAEAFLRKRPQCAIGRSAPRRFSDAVSVGATQHVEKAEEEEVIELLVPMPATRGVGAKLRKAIKHGLFFDLPHADIELFRIGVLAAALHRQRYTLIDWQRLGWITKPSFLVHGGGREKIRFYSAQQVLNANRLIVERYAGRIRFPSSAGFRDFLRALDLEMHRGAADAREGRK